MATSESSVLYVFFGKFPFSFFFIQMRGEPEPCRARFIPILPDGGKKPFSPPPTPWMVNLRQDDEAASWDSRREQRIVSLERETRARRRPGSKLNKTKFGEAVGKCRLEEAVEEWLAALRVSQPTDLGKAFPQVNCKASRQAEQAGQLLALLERVPFLSRGFRDGDSVVL